MEEITEFHLFAGIGGGIYGGRLLGHKCVGGVEIDTFCQSVLRQRQKDGWMDKFEIFEDVTELEGARFKKRFDVLCGGFPCQAFSTAAHGQNIAEKNLWSYMYQFIIDSDAPIVFGENVTEKAITKAKEDLIDLGYKVQICRLSCLDLGADHIRCRYWLLAVKDRKVFFKLVQHLVPQPRLQADIWTKCPYDFDYPSGGNQKRKELKAIGNAQSPFVAAAAFRILVNRHIMDLDTFKIRVSEEEVNRVFNIQETWLRRERKDIIGTLHTPTTMANYNSPSMQKHQGCRNYREVFGDPVPMDAEYLMGFPIGASYPGAIQKPIPAPWTQIGGDILYQAEPEAEINIITSGEI